MRSVFYGWKIVAALAVVMFVAVAFPMYGGSVLNAAMGKEFQLDHKMLGLSYAIFMPVIGLSAPVLVAVMTRIGGRTTIAVANLTIALGAALMAGWVTSGMQAALIFGVVVGSGVAFGGIVACQVVATRWFVQRRTMVYSILLVSSGVGAFIAPALLGLFVNSPTLGWRGGWWLVALLALVSAAAAAIFVRESPQSMDLHPDGLPPGTAPVKSWVHRASRDIPPREAIRTASFWAIVFGTNIYSGAFAMVLAHAIHHIEQHGQTQIAAAFSISTIMLCTVFAKGFVGAVGDRIDPRYIWVGGLALTGLGFAFAAYFEGSALLYAFPIAFGLGIGVAPVCMTATLANYFGDKHFAFLFGMLVFCQAIAGFATPLLTGMAFDRLGSYQSSWLVAAVVCVICAICLAVTPPPSSRDTKTAEAPEPSTAPAA